MKQPDPSSTDVLLDSLEESKALPFDIIKNALTDAVHPLAQIKNGDLFLSAKAAEAYRTITSTDISKTALRIDDLQDRETVAYWVGLGGSFIADFSATPSEARIFAWVLSPVPDAAQFTLKQLKGRDGRWVPTSLLATDGEFLSWIDTSKEVVNHSAVASVLDSGPVGFRFFARDNALPTYFMLREFDGFRAQAILPGRSPHWQEWLEQFTEITGHRFAGITSANLSDLVREVRSGGTHKDLGELQADMGHLGVPILSGPIAVNGELVPADERHNAYKSINASYISKSEIDREQSLEIAPISTSLIGFTQSASSWELLRHGSIHEKVLAKELKKHGIELKNCTQGRLELSRYVGDLVAAFPLFSDLSTEQIAEISQMIEMRSFEKGETIIVEGDRAEKIFFIASGAVLAKIRDGVVIRAGHFFGEISLIKGIPRTATVEGYESGVLLTLEIHIIYRLMEFLPNLADAITETAKQRLSEIHHWSTDASSEKQR